MEQHPNKYILVSFDGRNDRLIPFALQGYDIVDLSAPDWFHVLVRKLTDQPQYVLSPVTGIPPVLPPAQIKPLPQTPPKLKVQDAIAIEEPYIKVTGSASSGGLYNEISYDMQFSFTNTSGQVIDGFAYEVRVKRELMPQLYDKPVTNDGYLVFNVGVDKKIFNGQSVDSERYQVKVAGRHLRNILKSAVKVTIRSGFDSYTKEFPVETLFKTYRGGQTYGKQYSIAEPNLFN